jgi:hypothetical protein
VKLTSTWAVFSDIEVNVPFPVDSEERELDFGYLDMSGRPTVVLRKTACSEKHEHDVIVSSLLPSLSHTHNGLN